MFYTLIEDSRQEKERQVGGKRGQAKGEVIKTMKEYDREEKDMCS